MSEENKARGTVQEFKDSRGRKYYRARITLPDGERVWLEPRFDRRERAEEYADAKSREAERRDMTVAKMAPPPKAAAGEDCDKWHERYLAHCVERNITSVRSKRERWGKWISPKIGAKAIKDVTREDIEDVRDAIDVAIREYEKQGPGEGRLAHKTGQNIWGELTVSFGEASSSKRRDLKVRPDDPTSGVQPPERGDDKAKCYPYPSEFLSVAACEAIPLAWRELHAVAVYTYARPGELHVLTWADVDLVDQKIHVTKAWDYDAERVKSTKTHESREISIHPNLLPLLEAMKERAGGAGLVVPALAGANENKVAIIMRKHFEIAGCLRARLTTRSAAELRLRFRSWRDAGCTWAIVAGTDVVKVQRRAGHKLIATTMRYVVEAENRGATFGTPFPELPASLLRSAKPAPKRSGSTFHPVNNIDDSECRRRESKAPTEEQSGPFSAAIVEVKRDEHAEPGRDNPANAGRIDAGLAAPEPTDGELQRGILDALAAGLNDVARTLSDQLRARQRVATVRSIDDARKRR